MSTTSLNVSANFVSLEPVQPRVILFYLNQIMPSHLDWRLVESEFL